jgi:negative regulator of sigma E activity
MMSQTIEEQLSALLDGELPEAEEELLLRRLEREPAYRDTLVRYSRIGECLRGSLVEPVGLSVGDRVREAIRAEEPHAAASSGNKVSSVRRVLLGAGIAAAVAIVALISLREFDAGQGSGDSSQRVADSRVAISASGPDISYTVPSDAPRRAAIAPARLTGYLVSHGEYANSISRQVIDSHVVGQTPNSLVWEVSEVSIDD